MVPEGSATDLSQDPFATFSPLKRIDSYLYETTRNYKMATTREEIDAHVDESLHAVGPVAGRNPRPLPQRTCPAVRRNACRWPAPC